MSMKELRDRDIGSSEGCAAWVPPLEAAADKVSFRDGLDIGFALYAL
jgi:hypothetical protein